MFSRILVPLDGSKLAETALPYAEELAGAFNSEVILIGVVEPAGSQYLHMHQLYAERMAKLVRSHIKGGTRVKVKSVSLVGEPAQEGIPTALAVYNHQKVIYTTAVIDPREALKQTLSLVKDIILVELAPRFLQPPDIGKLRRNITQLKQATSEPAQRLLSMLSFEYQAIEEAAKNHPATLALSLTTQHAPPAIIILVSQLNHDAEALQVTAEKLSRRGFTRYRNILVMP